MDLRTLYQWLRRDDDGNHAARCDECDDSMIHDAYQRLAESGPDGWQRAHAAAGIRFSDNERAAMLARLRAALPPARRLFLASSEADRLAFVEGATQAEIREARAELGMHAGILNDAIRDVERRLHAEADAVSADARARFLRERQATKA